MRTTRRLAGVLALLSLAAPAGALGQAGATPPPDPADVATLDGIINAYYEVVSGPAGEKADRLRDQSLHHASALVAITGVDGQGTPTILTMSLGEYHDRFGGPRSEGFYEWEIHRETERFGNIAHVWSTYVASRTPQGPPNTRGINSIHLYFDGQRWWITSWIYDSERAGNPIPDEYLPQDP